MSALVEMDFTSPYAALALDPFLCPDDSIKDDILRFIAEQESNLYRICSSISRMSSFHILGQCTELRTVDICHHDEVSDFYLTQLRYDKPIVLPCLQQMSLGSATLIASNPIRIRTPVLQALRMTVRQFDVLAPHDVVTFFERNGNKLQHLQLHIMAPYPDTQTYHESLQSFLEKCLTALPNLRQLDIMSPELKQFVLSFADIEPQTQGIESISIDKNSWAAHELQLEDGLKATLIVNGGRDTTDPM
ncbi:hypothetical protein CYLTODRAFT_411555 [Cylindrobasidium torrendii FP15055 ss-10]|uniref:Uncharacterized protein n=1 Tax=Cylindrobasidium torrendii FP15055 ss-10 TaxID=1314674 RepID=A0A0D7B8Q0_9AGAR|nr:hypothetical protein CYLTODRAFT_411555 [Cylindrobasidium torrendii FP15055 ss-10]